MFGKKKEQERQRRAVVQQEAALNALLDDELQPLMPHERITFFKGDPPKGLKEVTQIAVGIAAANNITDLHVQQNYTQGRRSYYRWTGSLHHEQIDILVTPTDGNVFIGKVR